MRLAIVGAGIAGLAAAHRLRQIRPDLRVLVLEKSGGLGGRAATRRLHGAVVDHGAQYLKTPTAELQRFVVEELAHETLRDIGLPVWTFDGTGTLAPGDPQQNADPKWIYSDGFTRLARELAQGVDIRRNTLVASLRSLPGGGYRLDDSSGNQLVEADAVLLTPPAPQLVDLLTRGELPAQRRAALLAGLGHADYRSCLSIILGYGQPPREHPWYALVNSDRRHPISWLAYEHRKPGREMAGQGVIIAQMGPAWSEQHWDLPVEAVAPLAAELVSTLLNEDLRAPAWTDCRGWRYALPSTAANRAVLHAGDRLFFAGDYLAGQGRVHLAIESGWQAAAQIAAEL